MKNSIRISAALAGLALASPAFAHTGHGHTAQSVLHWVVEPIHAVSLIAIAATAFVIALRVKRG